MLEEQRERRQRCWGLRSQQRAQQQQRVQEAALQEQQVNDEKALRLQTKDLTWMDGAVAEAAERLQLQERERS
jgi:hypothetical protein